MIGGADDTIDADDMDTDSFVVDSDLSLPANKALVLKNFFCHKRNVTKHSYVIL